MKFQELLAIAGENYLDDLVVRSYNPETGHIYTHLGDTLALFIALELHDTFDEQASDSEQLDEACRAMSRALEDLTQVFDNLDDARLALLLGERG